MSFSLIHHGGRFGVTGSCHELVIDSENSILIDCGLFQGAETSDGGAGSPEIDFPFGRIRAVVLTHVHTDHVGRLPYLFAAGFSGELICSQATAALLPLVLEDSAKFADSYSEETLSRQLTLIMQSLVPLPYKKNYEIPLSGGRSCRVRLGAAGHILGSAWVQVTLPPDILKKGGKSTARKTVLFSGDLGAPYTPLLKSPAVAYGADTLVIESTYGDRLHEGRKDRRERLRKIIEHSLKNRGTVLIPAFSLGRTQELLYEIEEIIHRYGKKTATKGLPWEDLEIVIDSPLAERFTKVYGSLEALWDAEAKRKIRDGRNPLSFDQMTVIESHHDHLQTIEYLKTSGRPCIVIAASGMCSGGRIVNYLKALVSDPRHDVLFVGYQAAGTPGCDIQNYGPQGGYVEFDKKRYTIRAAVHTVSGYSAHADRNNLISFVKRMKRLPSHIRVVHGDDGARKALQERLKETLAGKKPGILID